MSNTGFHFAFAIRIGDTARQSRHAVVIEQIFEQRIQLRLIEVCREDTFAQIVQDNHAWATAQTSKCRFM